MATKVPHRSSGGARLLLALGVVVTLVGAVTGYVLLIVIGATLGALWIVFAFADPVTEWAARRSVAQAMTRYSDGTTPPAHPDVEALRTELEAHIVKHGKQSAQAWKSRHLLGLELVRVHQYGAARGTLESLIDDVRERSDWDASFCEIALATAEASHAMGDTAAAKRYVETARARAARYAGRAAAADVAILDAEARIAHRDGRNEEAAALWERALAAMADAYDGLVFEDSLRLSRGAMLLDYCEALFALGREEDAIAQQDAAIHALAKSGFDGTRDFVRAVRNLARAHEVAKREQATRALFTTAREAVRRYNITSKGLPDWLTKRLAAQDDVVEPVPDRRNSDVPR